MVALVCLTGTVAFVPASHADVASYGGDGTGWYSNQPDLSPGLVGSGSFGQEFSAVVDGQVDAQPLVANDTLLVATETNNIYGLDPSRGGQRWTRNLGTPWNPRDLGCADLTPSVGVTGAPVVDPVTNTMFLLSKTYVSGTTGPAAWYAHAMDITTGAERPNFPVLIAGTATNDPTQTFTATQQMQGPGLLLMVDVVYAAFGGHCDSYPYSGWVAGISTGGSLTTLWTSTSQTGGGAGIWQSGGRLVSDGAGQILLSTGNGDVAAAPTPGKTPPAALGEAVVRLAVQANGSVIATDYFAPYDAASLNGWDADLGSGAPLVLPSQFGTTSHPHLLAEVGKEGYLYLLDRDNLGGMGQSSVGGDAAVERVGPDGGVWGRPTPWGGDGGYVYVATASAGASADSDGGVLHAYQYGVDGSGNPTLSLVGSSSDAFGLSSSPAVVTSDGISSGTALVWVVSAPDGTGRGAQLRAYNPIPVNGTLGLVNSWPIGVSSTFNPPAVDNNHVYVGTRDGHVLGFGSPVTVPMTGSATTWPATSVGESSVQTATMTANAALTVGAVETTNGNFAAGDSSPPLPAALAAGQTLTVPVTFSPSTVGQISDALQVTTSIGSVSEALTGIGQSPNAHVSVNPSAISFGGVAVGRSATGSATFSNTGAQPLTVQTVATPVAPFNATGLPAVGFVLQPGSSFTVAASFSPIANGTYADTLTLGTSAGSVSVQMSGSAAQPPRMVIAPQQLNYGTVPTALAGTASFTIANTGGTALSITTSKPPAADSGFTATSTLPEGSSIAPGASVTETVRFAPTVAGAATDSWIITGDDGSGAHTVTFTGVGGMAASVPPPNAGGWVMNGSASLTDSGLELTDATTTSEAGSAFWPTTIDPSYLDVSFDATIDSGTGADGLTLALADPGAGAKATSLGLNGGGLGWSGIPGIAVALDTFKNGTDPSANFVGVATGFSPTNHDNLVWQTSTVDVPSLREVVRHIRVVVTRGQMSVSIDGTQVLTTPVVLPPTALLGFTGGDGGTTDRHVVSNVSITTLKRTVTAPRAPTGATATPEITAAMVKWVGPADNGGAPITGYTVAASPGGQTAKVTGDPAATNALVTGLTDGTAYTFTVTATNSAGTGPASTASNAVTPLGTTPVSVPSPTEGGWTMNGAALLTDNGLQLTDATSKSKAGSAFWPTAIDCSYLEVSFDAEIDSGTGADGLTLALGDPGRGAKDTSLGLYGGGLGWSGIPGIAVALDTFKNGTDPYYNFVGVATGFSTTKHDNLVWGASTVGVPPLRKTVRHIRVVVAGGQVFVSVDGTQVLTMPVVLPPTTLLGFTGGDGGSTDRHAVSNVTIVTA